MKVSQVATAIEQFHATFMRWPTNLNELQTNAQSIAFFSGALQDYWNRPFIYVPPTGKSSGRIGSYGKDSRPGGNKGDRDYFLELKND